MSVTAFDPKQISVTDSARRHITDQIERSGHRSLRLGVKESGCNGFMYTLDYIDTPEPGDHRFHVDGLEIFVRKDELKLVVGTQVDLVVEGLNAVLQFKNPNAQSYCGCGESFSMRAGSSQ
ncbi:MAG: iron-sulfur cluster assembly accessory protein [Pseudomonadales bacterium]|nr:iron-sulfur cluster assembly accessory protein [Pseudomonadales bacterium]